jgi:GAF domain-containing protein/HAMP domain-containing protein
MFENVITFLKNFTETNERRNKLGSRNALVGLIFSIALLGANVGAWLISGLPQFSSLISGNILLILGALFGYILSRLRIRFIPPWLMAIVTIAFFVIANFAVAGVSIILAITLVIALANIAIVSLESRFAILMIVASILSAAALVVIDYGLIPANRIELPTWLQQVLIVIASTTILFLTTTLLQSLELPSIRNQFTLAALLIALIPLATVLISSFITQNNDLNTIRNQELIQNINLMSNEIDNQLSSLVRQAEVNANLPVVRKYILGEDRTLLETFFALSEKNPYILSYGLLNSQGVTLTDIRAFRIGQDNKDASWFKETLVRQTGFISEIQYDESLVRPTFYVSAPVFNDAREIIGVVRVQYDAEILRDIMNTYVNRLGNNLTAMLVDGNGIILVHTSQPNLQLKTLVPLNPIQFAALQTNKQLPPGTAEALASGLAGLEQALRSSQGREIFTAVLSANETQESVSVQVPLTTKGWRIVAGQISTITPAEILQTNLPSLGIAGLIILAVIGAATATANLITEPINSLAMVAKEIGRGNLHISTGISRQDEIGTLARTLDETTNQLRNLLQSMEARVMQRTDELAQANALISQRAEQLKTISNVARAVNNLQSLQILLPQITEEISRAFGYYHVGIFLLDAGGQYAVLQAANSEGGRRMLNRGHRLRVGQVGIVGFVTGIGKPRIALDVGDDATFFNNPDLPQTRSEMALPLKSGNTVIGALDIQSEKPAAFTKEDIDVLSLLADQISIAIQNARLYEETRSALAEAQLIFSRNIRQSWSEIISSGKNAFRYVNGQVLEGRKPDDMLEENSSALELPIVIRGETLGYIRIEPQTHREWSEQDTRIFQSITDRLGFALENARLFRDAQRVVSKEQVIGEITDKISRSVNLENILQTAVEELGRIIGDSEVMIHIGDQERSQA